MDPAPAELPDETGQPIDDRLAPLLEAFHDALLAADTDAAQPALDATISTVDLDDASQANLVGAQQVLRTLVRARSLVSIAHSSPADGERDSAGRLSVWDALSRASGDALPLRQLGRFSIQRELGRGGFSVVFLAHDPVLNREVALKVPRPEVLITEGVRLRFDREAQAVARLTHPNLVPLFEVGEAGAIAYIVSAYCPGPTLAQLLHERDEPLAPRTAARLVAQLADAVHYAHTQGVLHRDIKPGNVLMEPVSAQAEAVATGGSREPLPFVPKLVDFGLAKLDDGDRVETRVGTALGTPGYMAPEQVNGRISAMGPATDVYGLGVLLYESITGARPFAGSNETDTFRRILSEDPPRPTNRVPQLSRDLEAICMKCLEKSPDRRYGSAALLADDLRRFLSGRSTLARPIGWVGTAGRWAGRNPWVAGLVTTVALLLVVIVVGSAVTAIQMARLAGRERESAQDSLMAKDEALRAAQRALVAEQRAERDATQARTQTQIALDEKKGAESIATFLTGLFTSSDPSGLSGLGLHRPEDLGTKLTASELLVRGATSIGTELRDQPVPRARILTALGGVCLRLEMLELAEKLLTEANEIRLVLVPQLPERESAAVLVELGSLRRRQRRYVEAEDMLRNAVRLREQLAGTDAASEIELADARFELAWLLSDLQRNSVAEEIRTFDEALELFDGCVANYQRLVGIGDRKTAAAMTAVLGTLTAAGRTDEIKQRLPEALEIYAQQESGGDVVKATTLAVEGQFERTKYQFDQAIVAYQESIKFTRKALGGDHPLLALMLGELAGTLKQAGRYAEAEAPIQEALELGWRLAPNGHPLLIPALNELADHRADQFDLVAAENLRLRAHQIALRFLDQSPWLTSDTLTASMRQYMRVECLPKLRATWEELFRLRGQINKSTLQCALDCTSGFTLANASDEMLEAVFREMVALAEPELSPWESGELHLRIAGAWLGRQHADRALPYARLAVERQVGARGARILPPGTCVRHLVEAELAIGDLENAELDARWLLAEAEPTGSEIRGDIFGAKSTLAAVLTAKGNLPEARELMVAARRIVLPDADSARAQIQWGSISQQLIDLELRLDNQAEAIRLLTERLRAAARYLNEQHVPELAVALASAGSVRDQLRSLDVDTAWFDQEWSDALAGFKNRPRLAEAIGTATDSLLANGNALDALPLCERVQNDTNLPANAPMWRTRRELERLHGICLTKLGRFDEAEELLMATLAEVRRGAGDHHVLTWGVLTATAELYEVWGKSAEAAEYRRLVDECSLQRS